jgi:8-amino-7-oxononanoate synthase
VAVKLGEDGRALEAAAALEDQGVLVVAIRPPTVPEGEAMLRFSLRPQLPEDALSRVLETLEAFKRP